MLELLFIGLAISTVLSNEPEPKPIEQHQQITMQNLYSEEEIELLTKLMVAEAEGESEIGKRLVVSTVLNRVDSEEFPNNIHDVVYQENQFSVIGGRINTVSTTDEDLEIVMDELVDRTNQDVLYFRTGRYASYGEPLFKEGNHYFNG